MTEIENLLEEEKIKKQLYLYCRAVDERKWDLLKDFFAEEHVHHHGSFTGSAEEFIGFASRNIENIKACQHSLSNILINISEDGLSAASESNFYAVHFVEAASVSNMHIQGDDVDTDWIVAGEYKDRWVCRAGKWLMIERTGRHIWDRVEPSRRPVLKTSGKNEQ